MNMAIMCDSPLDVLVCSSFHYTTEFFQTHKVSQQTFQAALDQFGAQHLTELTALMGHYAQTAFFLNAFEVQLPEQRTEPVLPV